MYKVFYCILRFLHVSRDLNLSLLELIVRSVNKSLTVTLVID